MKRVIKVIILCIMVIGISISQISIVDANADAEAAQKLAEAIHNTGDLPSAKPIYCANPGDCGLEKGVELVKKNVGVVKTEGTIAESVKSFIFYIYGFVALIGIIYIIYAGFRILVSNGEEEVVKKSKSTILYVIIGIAVILFAWPVTHFAISLGDNTKTPNVTTAESEE